MALTKAHNRMIEASAVNVKDFGAVGDGVTDDTAAIQLAFDEGGVIYFPSGTYLISSGLTGSSLYIMGNQATLKLSSVTFGAIELDGSNNVIEDLIIEGAGTTGQWSNNGKNFGIKFSGYSEKNNTIRNCKFTGLTYIAAELKSAYSSVEDSYFENCGYGGVFSANRFNNILNNQFISCANSTSLYTGCVISITYYETDGYNMATTLAERNVIDGNHISTSAQVGIDTHSGFNLVITNNIINNTDLEAIFLHRTNPADEGLTDTAGRVYGCVVDSNIVYNCLGGVLISSYDPTEPDRISSYENIISNNQIKACTGDGIALARGAINSKIVGNIVSDSEFACRIYYWSDSNYVTGNTFIANSSTAQLVEINGDVISTYYTDNNVVANNVFDLQGYDINAIDNNLGARYTQIKNNEFLNRGNKYPIVDEEVGTPRQALIWNTPRAYTSVNATVGDMKGEIQYQMSPSAGGTVGWVCTTAGDESSTVGVWKAFGTIAT